MNTYTGIDFITYSATDDTELKLIFKINMRQRQIKTQCFTHTDKHYQKMLFVRFVKKIKLSDVRRRNVRSHVEWFLMSRSMFSHGKNAFHLCI